MGNEMILSPVSNAPLTRLFAPTPKAQKRVVEFFTAQINNDHTRRAYVNATRRFSEWCAGQEIDQLSSVQPIHVAAFIKHLQGEFAPPTVKQHLGRAAHAVRLARYRPRPRGQSGPCRARP